MELRIIEWLQESFFQGLMYILSYAGHLFVVLGFAIVFYIAVDKKLGAKAFIFYFASMAFNGFLKVWIGRGRPYTQGANQIIEQSHQPSMPSGHAQGFASLLVPFACKYNSKKSYIISAILLLFLCFTRVYLGQHYISDVLVGALIGIALGTLLEFVDVFFKDKAPLIMLGLIPIFIILMSIFHTESYLDAYVSCGLLFGALIGVFFELRYVKYEVKGKFLNRVLKVLFSLLVSSVTIMPVVLMRDLMLEGLFRFLLFFLMSGSITLLCPFLIKLVFDRKDKQSSTTTTVTNE